MEDVVGDAVLSVASQLKEQPADFPPAWFSLHGPTDDADAAAFNSFAWTVLRRRFHDELRRRYVRELAPDDPSGAHDPEPGYLARQTLRRLSAELELLSEEDRSLVMDAVSGSRSPMSSAERVRLMRLRSQLVAALKNHLTEVADT